MLHRKFKVVKTKDLNSLDAVLNSGKELKSIAICETSKKECIVSIGYDDVETKHKYHLVVEKIGSIDMPETEMEQAIESHVEKIEGIICQDITEIDGELYITLLTVIE